MSRLSYSALALLCHSTGTGTDTWVATIRSEKQVLNNAILGARFNNILRTEEIFLLPQTGVITNILTYSTVQYVCCSQRLETY